jgi:hypothetical protein
VFKKDVQNTEGRTFFQIRGTKALEVEGVEYAIGGPPRYT